MICNTNILTKIGMSDRTCSAISFTFDCMEIAEQEIAYGKAQYPQMAKEIDGLFGYLCPPPGMRDFGLQVYRAYVKEQVERVATQTLGRMLLIEQPTKVEVLMALSRISEKAPLTPDATKLYFDLFAELFPDHYILKEIEPHHESHKGASTEIKRDIIKHLGLINRGGK